MVVQWAFLFFSGIVEGLQIALVELKRQHPDSYKTSHPRAYVLGQVAAKGDNVERWEIEQKIERCSLHCHLQSWLFFLYLRDSVILIHLDTKPVAYVIHSSFITQGVPRLGLNTIISFHFFSSVSSLYNSRSHSPSLSFCLSCSINSLLLISFSI